jgi:hypothetical protein
MSKKNRAKAQVPSPVALVAHPEAGAPGPAERVLIATFDFLSSLRLAIVLLSLLSLVLAIGTVWESRFGHRAAQFDCYQSWFFWVTIPLGQSGWQIEIPITGLRTLLPLLGINVLCAALSRYPWKKHHTGFLITHAGLLVLLAGSFWTNEAFVDGRLIIREGNRENTLLMLDDEVLNVRRLAPDGTARRAVTIPLALGARTWPAGRTQPLDLRFPDVQARIERYIASAKIETRAKDTAAGDPMLKLRLHGSARLPNGTTRDFDNPIEIFLGANGMFSDERVLGPVDMVTWRLGSATELQDFLSPPAPLPESGVLHVHYQGKIHPVAVAENLKKRVAIEGTPLAVTIERYERAPDLGGEHSADDGHGHSREPNPVLLLSIEESGTSRQHAVFAGAPHLPTPIDAFHGESGQQPRFWPPRGDLKLWFHHPDAKPSTLRGGAFAKLRIVITPSNEIYHRLFNREKLLSEGKWLPGEEKPAWMGLQLALTEFRPSVISETYLVRGPMPDDGTSPLSAVRIGIVTGQGDSKRNQSVWVQKTETSRIALPDGDQLELGYTIHQEPLAWELQLKDFEVTYDPGTQRAATYSSYVQLRDSRHAIDREVHITMNQPLQHDGYKIFQASFERPDARGIETSIFEVVRDPGYGTKMLGCAMICGGILVMFYMRAYFFAPAGKRREQFGRQRRPRVESARSQPVEAPAAS